MKVEFELMKGPIFKSIVPHPILRLIAIFTILLVGATIRFSVGELFVDGRGGVDRIVLLVFVSFIFLIAVLFVLIEQLRAGNTTWKVLADQLLISKRRKTVAYPFSRFEQISIKRETGFLDLESPKLIVRLHLRTDSGRIVRFAIRLTLAEGSELKKLLETRMQEKKAEVAE